MVESRPDVRRRGLSRLLETSAGECHILPAVRTSHACGAPVYWRDAAVGEAGSGRTFAIIVVVVVISLVIGVLLKVFRSATSRSFTASGPTVALPDFPAPKMPAPPRPPLPPLPKWERHLPADLPPVGKVSSTKDFRGKLFTQPRFGGESLQNAIFAGAELSQASFEKADLRGADFRGASLSQTQLAGADLAGAKFDEAYFSQSYLESIDTAAVAGKTRVRNGITEPLPPPAIVAQNAGQATFVAARFQQCSLQGVDFSGADFHGAAFFSVNLSNTDLRNADLRDTRHSSTDFKGAKLDGADLRGADLSFVSNLTPEQIKSAKTDETTRMPRF